MLDDRDIKTQIIYRLCVVYIHIDELEKYDLYNAYDDDIINNMKKDSIYMRLSQIGECATKIDHLQQKNSFFFIDQNEFPLKDVSGLRNIIVHTYSNIKEEEIYRIIKNDIPKLKVYILKVVNNDILKNYRVLEDKNYDDLILSITKKN